MANYLRELTDRFGNGWNRFWFAPADPLGVSLLRLLTGALALAYLCTFNRDLDTWFRGDGLLPISTVRLLTAEPDQSWNARPSYFYLTEDLGTMWALHALGMVVVTAYLVGFATRITNVLSLGVVLSYIHRAPMITGQVEPVLTLLLAYLCFAPSGAKLSVDSWLRRQRSPATVPPSSLAAGITIRLIQVHVALLYVMMGLDKLGGSDAWWSGQSVWWLIAHSESRLVDGTFLARHDYLLGIWTQSIVALELAFGLLIWHRLARPLLLLLAAVHWVLLGLLTGMLYFAASMLIVNIAFVSPEMMARFLSRWTRP